jgi:hypothetical protein
MKERYQPKLPLYSTVEGLLLDDIWKKEFFIVFSFTINITTSKLTKTSHYSKRQQKLYDKIKELKEVEGLSYRKISEKLEKLRYRSVRSGKVLKPNYIFSIYKKGEIREERINREFKDRISDMDFELVKNSKFVV